jgi:hypothetical protein
MFEEKDMSTAELDELAKELYEHAPDKGPVEWSCLHHKLQRKWVRFAEFAYGLIKEPL